MRYRSVIVAGVLSFALSAQAGEPDLGLTLERRGLNLVAPEVRVSGKLLHAPKAVVAPAAKPVSAGAWLAPWPAPAGLEAGETVQAERVTRQLRPGEAVVRRYRAATGTLEVVQEEADGTLTEAAWEAVALAPEWLRTELTAKFARLTPYQQDQYAPLLTQAEDPRYLDELAFLIAHTTVADLTHEYIRPRYLSDQVKFLYQAEPLLDYVSLVEHGSVEEGDFWTTVRYRYTQEGEEQEWELPRDHYYWWIVHPRLDGEPLHDIRPDTGKFAGYPLALTFKEFYLFTPDPETSYTNHYTLKDPPPYEAPEPGLEAITEAELNGWGPSQQGAFVDLTVGPNHLTRDSQGRTTSMEFRIRHKGIVLATTLLVEKAYADGTSNLLQTFLRHGPGNVPAQAKHPHLVVMDEAPFGLEGVVEGVLDEFEVSYTVIGCAALAGYDLTAVRKIIVPSDQPLACYQALADNREALEEWAKANWNILEIHGAVSSADKDWSGLVMPGGFTAEGVFDQPDDVVTTGGQPALADVIGSTTHLWDSAQYKGLSGDRLYDVTTFAVDKLLFWASQNIWDSIIDWAEKHPWFGPERSVQAVRVAYNHFGNCGENQDIVTAGSRSVLIAAANTSNGCEDHVWSEFFLADEWHTYQIGWSDGNADIDTPGISSGKKWGGGKNISFVTQTRGDGALINRTDYYHQTGELTVNVEDAEGTPIQGAWVFVFTETYYKQDGAYPLTIGYWDRTDAQGRVTIAAGANIEDDLEAHCKDQETEYRCNNYYLRVMTYFGNFPEEDNTVTLAVEDIEAGAGFSKEVTVTVPATLPDPRPLGTVESAAVPDEARALVVTWDALREMECGLSAYAGRYCQDFAEGTLDFYVLDEANYEAYAAGEPYNALAVFEGVGPGFEFASPAPAGEDWYLVAAHQHAWQHEQLVDLTVQVVAVEPAAPVAEAEADVQSQADLLTPEPDVVADDAAPGVADTGAVSKSGSSSGGCTAGPAPVSFLPFLLLLALAAVLRVGIPPRR